MSEETWGFLEGHCVTLFPICFFFWGEGALVYLSSQQSLGCISLMGEVTVHLSTVSWGTLVSHLYLTFGEVTSYRLCRPCPFYLPPLKACVSAWEPKCGLLTRSESSLFNHRCTALSPIQLLLQSCIRVLEIHIASNNIYRMLGFPFDSRWSFVCSLNTEPCRRGVSGRS